MYHNHCTNRVQKYFVTISLANLHTMLAGTERWYVDNICALVLVCVSHYANQRSSWAALTRWRHARRRNPHRSATYFARILLLTAWVEQEIILHRLTRLQGFLLNEQKSCYINYKFDVHIIYYTNPKFYFVNFGVFPIYIIICMFFK